MKFHEIPREVKFHFTIRVRVRVRLRVSVRVRVSDPFILTKSPDGTI